MRVVKLLGTAALSLPAALSILAAPAQASSSAAPDRQLPLATFARLPQTEAPRISANGSAIAAKVRANGKQALAIIPLATVNARPEVVYSDEDANFDGSKGHRVVAWDWLDDENLLITVGQQGNVAGQETEERRVVAYNRTTKELVRLGWRNCFVSCGNVIWTSRSGPARILISRNASGRGYERLGNQEVIEVDVRTGRQEVLIPPRQGVQNWYADGEGNVRLGLHFDRSRGRLTALYRAPGEVNFRTVYREEVERYREAPIPIVFLPGDRAVVTSRHEGFTAVYEMNLTTMELGRRIYGVDGYDVGFVTENHENNGLAGFSYIDTRPRQHWLDARLREIHQGIEEAFGAGNARIVSSDRARETIVVHAGKPNQAGGYYLYDTKSGDIRHIGWLNNEFRDMELNPVSTIRYAASDGKKIEAVLTLPRRREAKNLPLIVLPHGGPWARDYEQFDMWAQPLAELGYAVVQPNFRGSSGYGYDWESASDGNWGERMQDDLLDAVTHLAGQGIADRQRVCIFGWSYGGYAASRAAQRDGQHYRCAISGAGVHDLPKMVAYDKNYLGVHGAKYLGSAASRLADVSPARFPAQYSIPILIVHGAKDQRVPVDQSRDLVAQLKKAGKVEGRDFVYLEQPENTHHLPLESDRTQLLEAMSSFLARHNPA